jgi:hypothetical protein
VRERLDILPGQQVQMVAYEDRIEGLPGVEYRRKVGGPTA